MIQANYMVAALLRMLIKELSEPFCDEEKRKLYIEDFQNTFDEAVSKYEAEDLEAVKEYMDYLIEHTNESKKFLNFLNANASEEEKDAEEVEEEQIREKFVFHVLSDVQSQIGSLIEKMDLTLEVINLGIDELKKYLPSEPSTNEEKKLMVEKENVSE